MPKANPSADVNYILLMYKPWPLFWSLDGSKIIISET